MARGEPEGTYGRDVLSGATDWKAARLDIDRYPGLGKRRTLLSFEECLPAVREVYPEASHHGSTGFERSYTIVVDGQWYLVAHHWSPRTRGERFHLRIRDPEAEPILW